MVIAPQGMGIITAQRPAERRPINNCFVYTVRRLLLNSGSDLRTLIVAKYASIFIGLMAGGRGAA